MLLVQKIIGLLVLGLHIQKITTPVLSLILNIMRIWFFFFLLGGSAFASEGVKDIYLWKGEHSLIGETLSIPHSLVVTNIFNPSRPQMFFRG